MGGRKRAGCRGCTGSKKDLTGSASCHSHKSETGLLEIRRVTIGSTSFVETLSERSFRLAHLGVNQCLQAAITPSFLEPDSLTGTNITAHFPPILWQRLQLIAVGAKPQRHPLPLTIRFRKRNRHFGSPFGCNYT